MYRLKSFLILIFPFILLGCFQSGQTLDEIDVPQSIEEDEATKKQDNEQVMETVERELFLIDSNGHVASQMLSLPKLETPNVAEQVLYYLIKDGPVTEILPNGFSAVLPAETEVLGLNLQDDGTLIVDLSEEFKNYEANDELKILEAMTFTLTQFPNIERIKLQINGSPIEAMPINGTPVAQGYTREKGINLSAANAVDLLESERITMFYPNEYNNNRYYVPVTEYVEKSGNKYQSIMQILMDGIKYKTFITDDIFDPKTMLVNKPQIKNDVLQLHFNEYILEDVAEGIIADEVMETLVRTFTGLPEIEAIEVNVQNIDEIFNENGEKYDAPVDANMFTPTEKM